MLTNKFKDTYTRTAFTLIELLVVISIIAMLMAIIMPALGRVRETAKRTVCLSNMRQIGLMMDCYLVDNRYRLPPSSCHINEQNWRKYWLYRLSHYAQADLLYKCPSDKSGREFVNWTDEQPELDGEKRWSSFAYNALLDEIDSGGNKNSFNNIQRVRHADKCVWITEAPLEWTNEDHLHPDMWFSVEDAKAQVDWDRHIDKANYLFVDGHAEPLEIEETLQFPHINLWFPQYAPTWPKF